MPKVKAPDFEEQFLPDCEPKSTPRARHDETTTDHGWAIVTKRTRFEWDKDSQDYRQSNSPPQISVKMRVDSRVTFEPPFSGVLDLDKVGEMLEHVKERQEWYKAWKKELEEQLADLTMGNERTVGREWVAYKISNTSTKLRRRNDNDEQEEA